MKHRTSALLALVTMLFSLPAEAQQKAAADAFTVWQHAGAIALLTTPDGANLPAGALEENFPVLVRLDKDWFDFRQAKPNGEDVRFATVEGAPLAYQIEEWDAVRGTASIWVRVPKIEGNARQMIRVFWGNVEAATASDGKAVFNESNGYVSVWHLGDVVQDEVGTLESKDTGTTVTAGMVGKARHFPGKAGVFGGDKIPNYPLGSSPHSTEAWFRAEKPNSTVVAWGNEQAQGKVVMQFRSPPHVQMDCYFSGGNVSGATGIPLGDWTHVVHTYQQGESILYVNGLMDGTNATDGPPLAIKSPARLWLGGWYDNYDFVGDLDEVRIAKAARSADWVRLEYENQKPLQTLVGPVVQAGTLFAVSPAQATVAEGNSVVFSAEASGALKVYWSLKRGDEATVVAVDRFAFSFEAGRVSGDSAATLQFKAVYPDGVKTKDIPITIQETIPDPIVTLTAPRTWDGRSTIDVMSQVRNLAAMRAAQVDELKTEWSAGPLAVIKEVAPGKLILKRAQNSGTLTVTATITNGGDPITESVNIAVTEPTSDPWLERTPDNDEKPVAGQFYARDERGEGTLFYHGTLADPADSVFLKLYADEKLVKTETAKVGADKSYALSAKLKPGLIKYKVEFGIGDTGAGNGRRSRVRRCIHHRRPVECARDGHRREIATGNQRVDPKLRPAFAEPERQERQPLVPAGLEGAKW